MKQFKKEEVIEPTSKETLVSITCNKCGKIVELDDDMDFRANEFQTINLSFGYGSRYDMESWDFDLCEECVTEFVKTFNHVPNGFGADVHDSPMYPQTMFEEWKETGVVNTEAGMSKEEIEERDKNYYSYDLEEE